MPDFQLTSDFTPSLDQEKAIESITEGILNKRPDQTLLGVTGSGKTFAMANIIQNIAQPTLIMTHNKTLTAQLYNEFKEFFPNNAVEYFVSYYDYYQPEAYVPSSDVYIEKDSAINDNLDKLRLSATRSLFEREDVIIVSSVSCIYGLGSPEAYSGMMLYLMSGQKIERKVILSKLVEIQYKRNNIDFHRGTFRVRGDVIDIYPAYDDFAVRVTMFGDDIESLCEIDPITGKKLQMLTKFALYPASHYVQPKNMMPETLRMIKEELAEQHQYFIEQNKLIEAQRIMQRTELDMEMLEETGTCAGVENYSRIMTRRNPGDSPPTLIDYFPKSSLLFLDESHVSLPQIGAMYKGDYSRKRNLVDFGFRLPSALDNRPLKFEEFESRIKQTVYVSATPSDYELEKSKNHVVEMITRPTGLLDPAIIIRPVAEQLDDCYAEIIKRNQVKEKTLVTVLTKRMAEDLTDYYKKLDIRVQYLHSDIDAIERTEIIRALRSDQFDVLIGINLLREGLDIPEVSFIGIFDADKEGFLRSYRSLLQTCGRAARNVNGTVVMYADRITDSIKRTLEETDRRRKIQIEFNKLHNITPTTILKKIHGSMVIGADDDSIAAEGQTAYAARPKNLEKKIKKLHKDMLLAARNLDFEKAALLRDELNYYKNLDLGIVE